MLKKAVSFIFFSNYFVAILAVALSIETLFQLKLPFNSLPFYILTFSAVAFYYTLAYSVPGTQEVSSNPRTEWYRVHAGFVRKSQLVLLILCIGSGSWLTIRNFEEIISLPTPYWLILSLFPIAAVLYYGLLPRSFISFNLRQTGWLKAFIIGFVWAGCVNVFPITMLKIEQGVTVQDPMFMFWLFVKNWMFCAVNAIMFDIKDYEDDSNIELKTFAVRFGLTNTIYYVLLPILLVGLGSYLTFAINMGFFLKTMVMNIIPFICMIQVAFSLQQPRNILYYLIVIDGLLLVKAICGIAGTLL